MSFTGKLGYLGVLGDLGDLGALCVLAAPADLVHIIRASVLV